MSEFEHHEDENNYYEITNKILEIPVSFNEVDQAIDNYIDGVKNEELEEKLFVFVLQLFYRSGKKETSTNEVLEKINLLIADRLLDNLKSKDLVDEVFDVEENDYVYSLTEKGKKYLDDNL